MRNNDCPERTGDGKPHCWHSISAPIMQPKVSASFPSACCFCAPSWMHMEVFVLTTVDAEEVEAVQMLHGPLVTVQRRPTMGPQLVTPGR